MNNYIFGYTFI